MPCPGHSIRPPFLLWTHMPICTHSRPSLTAYAFPEGLLCPRAWGSDTQALGEPKLTARASGLSSFPHPEPSRSLDPVTSSFLGLLFPRASRLLMPAWHLASTKKPPKASKSSLLVWEACNSALGAKSWGSKSSGLCGPADSPWFRGEAAELRRQQGLSSRQSGGAQREKGEASGREGHQSGQDGGLEASWPGRRRDGAKCGQASP